MGSATQCECSAAWFDFVEGLRGLGDWHCCGQLQEDG
jgi:hypothetical protein